VTWFLDTALCAGAVGLVAGAFVPPVVARLPEPAREPEPALDALQPARNEAEFSRPLDDPKELYTVVAALPGLWWRTALASGLAAGVLGGRVGWDPALLFLVYLAPVCVALSLVDWRTRYLPTRLIAPSYLVVGGLVLVSFLVTSDREALVHAVVGWLGTFGVFFLSWFISPRLVSYGDVRLAGLLGMALGWLGVQPLVLGMYTGFVLGGIGGLLLNALRVFHRKHVPFGPFMVVGAFLGAAVPGELAAVYGWLVHGVTLAISAVVDAF
jgi:leader peptidase (prepilin peptidase)/N-methyltransferase